MLPQGQFGDTMGLLTQNLVTLIASLVIAFIKSWQVCLVVMAAMPVIGGAAYLQTKYMLGAADKEDETFAQANQTASEAFGNIRTIAAFSMEAKVAELFDAQLKKPAKESRTRALAAGAGFGASQFVLFAVYALAFWFGALLVSRGEAQFEGVLMAFFAIFLAAVRRGGAVVVLCGCGGLWGGCCHVEGLRAGGLERRAERRGLWESREGPSSCCGAALSRACSCPGQRGIHAVLLSGYRCSEPRGPKTAAAPACSLAPPRRSSSSRTSPRARPPPR